MHTWQLKLDAILIRNKSQASESLLEKHVIIKANITYI